MWVYHFSRNTQNRFFWIIYTFSKRTLYFAHMYNEKMWYIKMYNYNAPAYFSFKQKNQKNYDVTADCA